MTYELEDLKGQEPTRLVGEHRLLMQWLQEHPRHGRVEDLDSRLVDLELGLALYRVKGLGMSEGASYALVRGQDIFVFDAWRESRAVPPVASIHRVSIPAQARLSQAEIRSLIASGFSSYARLRGLVLPFPNGCVADFARVRWDVRPPRA